MSDPIHAILIEPQLARFRRVCDLEGQDLEVNFDGWHRHAILSRDRVFLFPRHRQWVTALRREAALLDAIDGRCPVVPQLVGQWHDPAISPYPFLAVSRLPGRTWGTLEQGATLDQVIALMHELGGAIASWHSLDTRSLPARFRRSLSGFRNLNDTLSDASLRAAATRLAALIGTGAPSIDAWIDEIEPLRGMAPVLVHGDVHEDQILVDRQFRVTGVLDWETAGVGHPLKDFDFSEWGVGIFKWIAHFDVLRRSLWEAYTEARGGDLPSWRAMHLYSCLADLPSDDDTGEWARERRANIVDLVGRLDETTDS